MIRVLSFICSFILLTKAQQINLLNRQIYTLQNKGDFGFLTSVKKGGQPTFAITDSWRDGPAQKWRSVKGFLGSSYMFKPISDEDVSIFLGDKKQVGVASSGFGLSSSQFWTIWKSEQGFFLVKNSSTDECLESQGLGKRVIVSKCKNTRDQQWAVHAR